jgi:hypothetical protein|tara:strand:+ start:46 stop:1311 length:1266 start_codon:yes stop_codon:yes gene_type:complete
LAIIKNKIQNMKNRLILIIISLSIVSCTNEKRIIEKIEFNNEYKFNSELENKILSDTTTNPHFKGYKHQIGASDYAKNGDYKNALIQMDLAMGTREKNFTKPQIDSINLKYSKVKAVDYIIEQAKNNQVVIINEAHHNSFHRVFTKSLLKELHDNGYTNLGLEALSNKDSLNLSLNNRKYPVKENGYYTEEPQFGNLIRDALEIGYNLFAYDNMKVGSGKLREIGQAKNIQKMIEKRPNEKFLIHCGFAHAYEGNYPSWEKAMAGRLTEYTGINPFTINQTIYTEKSKSEYNHPLLKSLNLTESSILLEKNNEPYKYERGESWTDVAVFHPNTEYINNRPKWLFENGNKNVPIELKEIDIPFPVMIFAFKKGENINNAIPIDIYEIENKSIVPHLALPKGKYEIVVVNKENNARKFEMEVE